MGSPKEVDVATSTAPTDTEEAQLRDSDRQADTQPEERAGNTSKCAQETRKQVQQEQDKAEATEKSTEHRGSAQEQEQVQKEQQISEPEEEMSVISSDASPHDSDFDFLQINTADGHGVGFSLFTPSPRERLTAGTNEAAGLLSSPPLSCGSSTACSPSRFFKSPLVSRRSTPKRSSSRPAKTPQRRTIVPIRLGTPKRLLEAIDSLSELEEKEEATTTEMKMAISENSGVTRVVRGRSVEVITGASVHLRTPSPSREQLSRRLKDVFDRTDDANDDDEDREVVRKARSNNQKRSTDLPDVDDMQCVPSGLLHSPNEHDSFFSFANSLSPLMPADEFDNSFMSVRLSPLVSLSSCDLPRLIPPFPADDDQSDRPTSKTHRQLPSTLTTPKSNRSTRKSVSSAGSLVGGGISAPGSGSSLASPSFFTESFPNIQASTSATPGKMERSKLGDRSVMKLELHTAFKNSSSLLASHPTREIQAINNSLKRKKYIRRRKMDENRSVKVSAASTNVQRKLLQTPVKMSTSPRSRSPLHPLNGRVPQDNPLKTPIPRKLASIHRQGKFVAETETTVTPTSPPIVRQILAPTDTTAVLSTPTSNPQKHRTAHCLSTPSSMATLQRSPIIARQVPAATTAVRRVESEVIATPLKNAVGGSPFDSSMLKTPTPVGSSSLLTMSLHSASQAPLGAGVVAMPVQKPKKAPCNCKKSKCLKLYCECFASGGYCDESCNCIDCANTTEKEDVRQQAISARLEKNPNAFKPKIGATAAMLSVTPGGARRLSLGASGGSDNSTRSFLSPLGTQNIQGRLMSSSLVAAKMHKHGCHCKKSACQKKYCECFQAGVPCGENCRCIDCKNQAPCVSHANGAASVLGGTPSRIASELDETFVSPVLQSVRQRLRIDRETWTKNFSSPFEASPGRERQRTELLRSRLRTSTASSGSSGGTPGSSLSARVKSVPFASPRTPRMTGKVGAKRARNVSPVMGQGEEQRSGGTRDDFVSRASLLKECELQQYVLTGKAGSSAGKASLSAVASSSAGAERVFVLPLFGEKMPPLESGVSASIFRYLTNADLHNASLVNHLWNQVALGDTVWDNASFIPTEANVAAARRSRKKRRLEMPIKLEPGVVFISNSKVNRLIQDEVVKREPNLSVLSALR